MVGGKESNMPLYDVKCQICNKEFEHFCSIKEIETIVCNCGGRAKVLITNTKSQDWFKPHWNPNFDLEPVYIKSRNHYKQLCREKGLTPRCFGDVRNITEV